MNTKLAIVAGQLGTLLLVSPGLWAQEEAKVQQIAPAKPLVAVPSFENRTAGHLTRIAPGKEEVVEYAPGEWKLPDSASKIAADALSDALTRSRRFRVLSRNTFSLKQVDNERKFAMTSVGTEALMKLCKELNAQYLVTGALSSFRVDERKATAYGVQRHLVSTRISMDLRAVDVPTGEVVYHASPRKTVNIQIPEGVSQVTDIYDWEAVLRNAIEEASKEMILQMAKVTGASLEGLETVTIHVGSSPEGADIIMDGDFVGNTPSDVTIEKGRHVLRVERQGYQPWERRINAVNGFKASAILEKSPPPPEPKTEKQKGN